MVASATVELREDASMVSQGHIHPYNLSRGAVAVCLGTEFGTLGTVMSGGMCSKWLPFADALFIYKHLFTLAYLPPRRGATQAFSFRLSRLDVHDLFTQGAVFPHMLKVGGDEDGADSNSLELTKARAKV